MQSLLELSDKPFCMRNKVNLFKIIKPSQNGKTIPSTKETEQETIGNPSAINNPWGPASRVENQLQ